MKGVRVGVLREGVVREGGVREEGEGGGVREGGWQWSLTLKLRWVEGSACSTGDY